MWDWSDRGRSASSTGQGARASSHETEGAEYCVGNRNWMMRKRPVFECPDCKKWYRRFKPVDGVEVVRCRNRDGRTNSKGVWVDPHVRNIPSGARAQTEGDGQTGGESEVESGDSSDSSGRGSNFSDGSQMSDDDDDEYPEDDPEREAEAMEAYRKELRARSSHRAKEVADEIRADIRAGDTAIILAYPQEAAPEGEDVRLRPTWMKEFSSSEPRKMSPGVW